MWPSQWAAFAIIARSRFDNREVLKRKWQVNLQGGALNLAHIPLVPPFPWFVWSRPSTGEEGATLSFSSSNCYSNLKIVQNLRKKFVQSRPSTLPQVKKAPGSFSLLSLLKLEIICTKGLFGESHPSTGEESAALSFSFFLFFKPALLCTLSYKLCSRNNLHKKFVWWESPSHSSS